MLFYGLFRSVGNFLDRKAILACESEMTDQERADYRRLLKINPYRDAYHVVMNSRWVESKGAGTRTSCPRSSTPRKEIRVAP
jgi:hypothetical protein